MSNGKPTGAAGALPRRRLGALAAGLAGALSLPAFAQARAVTLVVAFPPGGEVDALARMYAERLTPRMGRNVVVENRSGASGTIGAAFVSRAAPDGDTLLLAPNTFAIAPHVMRRTATYDPVADFTPVVATGTNSLILMASRQSGIRTLADLVAQARGGRVTTYGTPGSGSPMNILGEMFNRAAGLQLAEVAYRGGAPVVTDLLSGTLAAGFVTPAIVAEHVRAGAMVPLAVSDRVRSPVLPEVPTFQEAGFDIVVTAWYGLFGPRGLPAAQVAALGEQMNAVLAIPELQERKRALGIITAGGPPERLAEFVRTDSERFGRIVREFNINAE